MNGYCYSIRCRKIVDHGMINNSHNIIVTNFGSRTKHDRAPILWQIVCDVIINNDSIELKYIQLRT